MPQKANPWLYLLEQNLKMHTGISVQKFFHPTIIAPLNKAQISVYWFESYKISIFNNLLSNLQMFSNLMIKSIWKDFFGKTPSVNWYQEGLLWQFDMFADIHRFIKFS